jgi:DUF4097 and DUF4098 domain-containing protein YvlB
MRFLLVSPLLLVSALVFAGSCEHQAARDLDIDAAGLRALVLKLGSSDLHARGVPGLKRIEVRGKACASDPAMLDKLQVSQRRDGDRVVVAVEKDVKISGSWFGSNYAYLDLEVRLPAELPLDVDASSGDSDIRDVASLAMKSSSGDVDLGNIAGEVVVAVSSGDIKANEIGSFALTSTGSGDVEVHGVRGDVKVDRAGSGDLHFERVGGRVDIGRVGSGDVTLRDITADVLVGSIGSGDITVDGVGGGLTVQSQGSGDTRHSNVKGRVELPANKRD